MASPGSFTQPWRWPALLDYGFRPFFLLASVWAVVAAIAVVVAPHFGMTPGPWHAREMIFGFGSAVLAGFLLTAVPTWTGRLPLANGPLLGLVVLWGLGRLGVATGVPALDLLFLPALCVAIGWPLVRARRWRAFKVAAALPVLFVAEAGLFAPDVLPAIDRHFLALAAYGWLIATVGGRLLGHLSGRPGHDGLDRLALALLLLALAGWTLVEPSWPFRPLMAMAGLAVLVRQARWRPFSGTDQIAGALHGAHAMLGLSLVLSAAGVAPGLVAHLFALGAMSLAMMAVMIRTTSRFLQKPVLIGRILTLIAAAALARAGAELAADFRTGLLVLTGLCWLLAHAQFLRRYGAALSGVGRPRRNPNA
jgi:uncharacterized protein involved in response to NO